MNDQQTSSATSNTTLMTASLEQNSLAIAIQNAEANVTYIARIKQIALKVTNSNDWLDQGGKPYLSVSGAEKVARLFGVTCYVNEPNIEYEADGSGHFSYCCTGKFTLNNASIDGVIGARTSKDPFFKKYKYNDDGSKMELPISSIDKMDIKKAAYTNCMGNGITRFSDSRN